MRFLQELKEQYERNRGVFITQMILTVIATIFALLVLKHSVAGLRSGKPMPSHMDWYLFGMLASLGVSNVLTAIDMKMKGEPTNFQMSFWSGIFAIMMGILIVLWQ